MQSFELWHPTPDIPEYLSGALVLQPGYSELLVICDGEFSNGKCLVLSFGSTDAFQVYDDAAYPKAATKPKSGRFTIPFLKVINSDWAAVASPPYHGNHLPTHYSIVSLSYSVDVLSTREPDVRWVNSADVDALFDKILSATNA